MTNRIEPNEVRELITTTKTNLVPYIDAANQLVTELLGTSAFTAARLKEIERWLAAHFIAVSESSGGAVVEEETGDTRVKYKESAGENLRLSSYGMQVLMLDTTGIFANLGKRKARFDVI